MPPSKTKRVSFSLDKSTRLPARGNTSRIRRFNGLTRRTADWDDLKKDSQLWFENGNCLVYFEAHDAADRRPSLKLPFKAIESLRCDHLFQNCLYTHDYLDGTLSELSHDDPAEPASASPSTDPLPLKKTLWELCIPAPDQHTKEEAFSYHLTTRNLFAYAVSHHLVGESLSTALIDVWDRLQEWQSSPTQLADFTAYLDGQGYLDFTDSAEHALACLKLAEHARIRPMWLNAFAHCVGMHERLDLSPEFSGLSKTSAALITRASLEMDLHISRIVRALGGFLEDELGSENLGLSKPARDHLDRFRSFLHAFYVDKLGYFPPSQSAARNRRLWARVQQDFERLYELLADVDSTGDLASNRLLDGGVCVLQNIQAFDQRHNYDPLPHPLPLLPETSARRRKEMSASQTSLKGLRLSRSSSFVDADLVTRTLLSQASNTDDEALLENSLVQEYQRFERQKLEEKLDITEARKVRWILIYATLQMLNSIFKPPKGVRDQAISPYPLCIVTKGFPHWLEEAPATPVESDRASESASESTVAAPAREETGRTSRISIRPDCEADNAEDFFASNGGGLSRKGSELSLEAGSSPIRTRPTFSRTNSLRSSVQSSVQSLHRSVVGSLNRRSGSRRHSLQSDTMKIPLPETIPQTQPAETPSGVSDSRRIGDHGDAKVSTAAGKSAWQEFDFDLAAKNGEPTLESHQVELEGDYPAAAQSVPGQSQVNARPALRVDVTGSNRSSSYLGDDSSDRSLWDIESYKRDSATSTSSTPPNEIVGPISVDDGCLPEHYDSEFYPPGQSPSQHQNNSYRFSHASVHDGCYVPSGIKNAVAYRMYAHQERPHTWHANVYEEDENYIDDNDDDDDDYYYNEIEKEEEKYKGEPYAAVVEARLLQQLYQQRMPLDPNTFVDDTIYEEEDEDADDESYRTAKLEPQYHHQEQQKDDVKGHRMSRAMEKFVRFGFVTA